jgi:eukaryotic-like serine/threonine-protein kinase
MSILDAAGVAQLALRLNLLAEEQVRECWFELDAKTVPPAELLGVMERKGYITPFQGSKLLKGDIDGYLLGGYRLLYKIAAGTFGRVYRGDNPRTGEIVAIKVLRKRWLDNAQKIELFEREGRMGLTLRHPNIVSILAVNRDPATGAYYIVMEFVEGGNLRDILKIRGKLSPPEALRILDEAANGLAHAYAKGMTHRDVKPSNILISAQDGVSKLVDFGLAELHGTMAEEDDTTVDQSVDYAGLEQATGCKPGDVRSDIYFLGCTLFQMLTGEPLLTVTKDLRARKHKMRFDVAHAINRDDPNIPHQVHTLLTHMVALEPTERYQTPVKLLEAIRNVRAELEGEGVLANGPSGPKTVYVVEPHEKFQDIFRERLKRLGYRVLMSKDATLALKRFQQEPYHALLVDVETAGPESLEPFESVMREAEAIRLACTGIVIIGAKQGSVVEGVKPRPRVAILRQPGVTTKHIADKLRSQEEEGKDED